MIDRLIEQIRKKNNPSVVGLDPAYSMIPGYIRKEMLKRHGKTPKAVSEMFLAFNKAVIDAVHDIVPAVKPQIAMYEQYGPEGVRAYIDTVGYAKEKGLIVVGDVKRGDIASTAEAYAGHLAGVDIEGEFFDPWREDAVTVNPYLGVDGIEPFIGPCNARDKGLFILVKTSNPGSGQLQDRLLEGEPLYARVADLVSEWGLRAMGNSGYSRIGAVVGATWKEQGKALRERMPHTFFLVPGYGAQGGSGEDLKDYFDKDGLGILVNSSRGIIAAYQKHPKMGDPETVGAEFAEASRQAALDMAADITRWRDSR